MRRRFLVLVLCLMWAARGMAQVPHSCNNHCHACWSYRNCPSLGCCVDDYCRKCLVICPLRYCGGPDDYCRKTPPCLTNVPHCGGCDDYCRKPFPRLLCPPFSPYLQCGPPEGGCVPSIGH
jgi:hypothetical protein